MSKTIIITGATSGIGLEITKTFAFEGHRVIGIARNQNLIDQCLLHIKKESPNANISFIKTDLSNLDDIKNAALEITNLTIDSGVDVLINNAAIVPHKKIITKDGFEMQYQVNHLAGVYFSYLLFPQIQKAKGIIITTTSRMHILARFNPKDIMGVRCYHMLRSYCRTKLYNLLFTKAFREIISVRTDVLAYAVHPGLVKTGIGTKSTNSLFAKIWNLSSRKGKDPKEVVKTYSYIINNNKKLDQNSFYYHEENVAIPHKRKVTFRNAKTLWKLSNEHLQIDWETYFKTK